MSVIWDLIQEQASPKRLSVEKLPTGPLFERRRSERASLYVPLFVYGYNSAEEPFYQETNSLQVNANGGLLHLDAGANVQHGQKLLLMNRVTKEEQECYVVSFVKRPKHAELRVGVAFANPAPEFWAQRKANSSKAASNGR